MVRLNVRALDWAGLPESVTCKPIGVEFAGADGVPVIAPLAVSASPGGSVPLASFH